jgi:hypothetical protein
MLLNKRNNQVPLEAQSRSGPDAPICDWRRRCWPGGMCAASARMHTGAISSYKPARRSGRTQSGRWRRMGWATSSCGVCHASACFPPVRNWWRAAQSLRAARPLSAATSRCWRRWFAFCLADRLSRLCRGPGRRARRRDRRCCLGRHGRVDGRRVRGRLGSCPFPIAGARGGDRLSWHPDAAGQAIAVRPAAGRAALLRPAGKSDRCDGRLSFFVMAALRCMLALPREAGRRVASDAVARAGMTLFLRGRGLSGESGVFVESDLDQRSHVLRSLLGADTWLRVEQRDGEICCEAFDLEPALT